MFVLDTNAIIYYLKQDEKACRLIEALLNRGEQFAISIVTEVELLSFPGITPEEIIAINDFLVSLIVVNLDRSVGSFTTTFRKHYRLSLADSVIAATAYFLDAPLVTRNVRDFTKIREISVSKI